MIYRFFYLNGSWHPGWLTSNYLVQGSQKWPFFDCLIILNPKKFLTAKGVNMYLCTFIFYLHYFFVSLYSTTQVSPGLQLVAKVILPIPFFEFPYGIFRFYIKVKVAVSWFRQQFHVHYLQQMVLHDSFSFGKLRSSV